MKKVMAILLAALLAVGVCGCGQNSPKSVTYKHLTYQIPDGFDFSELDDGEMYTHSNGKQLVEIMTTRAPQGAVTEANLTDTARGMLGESPEEAYVVTTAGGIDGLCFSGDAAVDGAKYPLCGFLFVADGEIYCVAAVCLKGDGSVAADMLGRITDTMTCDVSTEPVVETAEAEAEDDYVHIKDVSYKVPSGFDTKEDGEDCTHSNGEVLLKLLSAERPSGEVEGTYMFKLAKSFMGDGLKGAEYETIGSITGMVSTGTINAGGIWYPAAGFVFVAGDESYCLMAVSYNEIVSTASDILHEVVATMTCDVPTEPVVEAAEAESEPEPEQEHEPESEPEQEMVKGIPGTSSIDLIVGMCAVGFPADDEKFVDEFDGTEFWRCELKSVAGATQSYIAHRNQAGEITKVVFDYSCAILGDPETANVIAALEGAAFIGYCSTFGYADNDTDAARQWVLDHYMAAFSGETSETDIGSAHFELEGMTGNGGYYAYLELKITPK